MIDLAHTPIVCLGYHPWSPMWKRNQSMMAEFARQRLVERVVFLNPEVSLMTSPARVWRECRTVRRYSYERILPAHPAPRVTVLTPAHWLPLRRRLALVERLDRAIVAHGIRRALGGERSYILLVNTVRPESQELVELLWDDAVLRVFDWSDDFSRFPLDPAARSQLERITDELLGRVDLVLAVNANLAARAARLNEQVATVINATNMPPRAADAPLIAGAAALGRTLRGRVIGYAGFINEHRVDLELVVALARAHPEHTILFLGPVQLEFDRRFPDLPNVRFVPAVPYAELQDYLSLFDVCIIPHLDNAHTAGNNPLKLYDYLTTGRPIVSTRVAGLEGFEDVVRVADGHQAFIRQVAMASEEGEESAVAARLARAEANHWSARARQAAAVIAAARHRDCAETSLADAARGDQRRRTGAGPDTRRAG